MIPKTLHMTGRQLSAWREKLELTQTQLAQLARKILTKRRRAGGGFDYKAGSIQKWEDGTRNIPPDLAELLLVKFYLLETGQATFEDLVNMSLADVLKDMGR